MVFCKHRLWDRCIKDGRPCIFNKDCVEPEEDATDEYIENESVCHRCFHSYVCEQFNEHRNSNNEKCHFFNDHFVPAADVAPVVHGRWVPLEYDGYADGNPVWDLWECSECQEEHCGDEDTLTPYCHNCGAKMDGDGNG